MSAAIHGTHPASTAGTFGASIPALAAGRQDAGRPVFVITDNRFGETSIERAVLDPLGVELREASCRTAEDVIEAGRDADALLVNMAPISAVVAAGLERCKVVSRYGVGMDNVDVAACAANGIAVANVPGYCDAEVAEHALALLLALTRGTGERDRAVRDGRWNVATPQYSVAGSVIGVAGFGGAGKAFSRAVLALRPAELLLWSLALTRSRVDEELAALAALTGTRVRVVTFDELITRSDVLSIHLALNAETKGLFGADVLSRMKPGAFIVNTARGGLVDSSALAAVLHAGVLAGAAIDTLDREPPGQGHPLLSAPGVIFTDHSAYRSVRSLVELRQRCALNAARALGLLRAGAVSAETATGGVLSTGAAETAAGGVLSAGAAETADAGSLSEHR